jgi:hypothetical protein
VNRRFLACFLLFQVYPFGFGRGRKNR